MFYFLGYHEKKGPSSLFAVEKRITVELLKNTKECNEFFHSRYLKKKKALIGRENVPRVHLDVRENNDKTRTRDNHNQVSAWQIKERNRGKDTGSDLMSSPQNSKFSAAF